MPLTNGFLPGLGAALHSAATWARGEATALPSAQFLLFHPFFISCLLLHSAGLEKNTIPHLLPPVHSQSRRPVTIATFESDDYNVKTIIRQHGIVTGHSGVKRCYEA
jgi:hypothetical protein